MGLKTRICGGGTKVSPKTRNPRKGTETHMMRWLTIKQTESEDP